MLPPSPKQSLLVRSRKDARAEREREKTHQSAKYCGGCLQTLLASQPNPVFTPTLPQKAATVIAERLLFWFFFLFLLCFFFSPNCLNNCVDKWLEEIWDLKRDHGVRLEMTVAEICIVSSSDLPFKRHSVLNFSFHKTPGASSLH